MIHTKIELIEFVRGFSSKETAFDAMKLAKVDSELAEWFYNTYALKNKNKSQKDAFFDFYNENVNTKFYSNAQWPLDVYRGSFGNGISSDNHNTKEQAQGVCDALMREGFGGNGLKFPIRTWVSSKPEGD